MSKKKIVIPNDILDEMVRLYKEEYIGTPTLSERFGFSKDIINRTLRECGVELGTSGRKWTGGLKEARKRYEIKHKEKRDEYKKQWSKENRKYLREYHAKWRENNIEHHREYKRNYEKTKKDSDPQYKLSCYTRTAIYTCLKERNIDKDNNTFELLPYNLQQLVEHQGDPTVP